MSEYALKEWDSQVQALTSGQTAVIVRKGGIVEKRDQFEVEHRAFYLYPTFLHQNPGELRSEFQPLLRRPPAFGQVCIPAYAEVLRVWKVETLEQTLALEPYQPLNARSLEARFRYRDKPWVHALLLRVETLKREVCIPETDEYLGCVSWVPLRETLEKPTSSVLDAARVQALEVKLAGLLGPGF